MLLDICAADATRPATFVSVIPAKRKVKMAAAASANITDLRNFSKLDLNSKKS